MATVPMPSHTGSPVSIVNPTPVSANTRPINAPVSSSSTTGSSGLRDVRMKRHQLTEPLSGRDSTIAVRKLKPSSPIATTRMAMATTGEVSACGVADLVIALVEGEHRPQREQHQRHHERIEVATAAVPERVQLIGLLARLPLSEQQQPLIGGVGDGVHGLGEHG